MPVGLRLSALALLALFPSTTTLSAQATTEYGRAWSTDRHGAEALYRPFSLIVAPGCGVWAADPGNSRVYRWTCEGGELPAVGRRGEGPGEFSQPTIMQRFGGDTIAVWDRPLLRLSLFSSSGDFVDSERLEVHPTEHGFVRAFGRARPHTLVATDNYPGMAPRPNDDQSLVWLADAMGAVERPLVRVDGPTTFVQRGGDAIVTLDGPFRHQPVFFFHDGLLLVGSTGHDRLFRYRVGPVLRRLEPLDLDIPARRVTRRDRSRWTDSTRTRIRTELSAIADGERRQALEALNERLVRRVEFPATHPRYDGYANAVSRDGRLWLMLADDESRGSTWRVYDLRRGVPLRTVRVPSRGRVRAAAAEGDRLFLVETDADGVATLDAYVPRRP